MASVEASGGLRRDVVEAIATARGMQPRKALRDIVDCFATNDLLTYASAIAFQVFFALVPAMLFVLGLLGAFHLDDVYRSDLAPEIRRNVSPAVFGVVDDTARNVLGSAQVFWVTFGGLLAVWKVAGAMRAVIGVLDRIYGVVEERGTIRRFAVSLGLAAVVGVLLLGAIVVVQFGGGASGGGGVVGLVTTVLRWILAVVLLLVTMAVIVHFAPAERRPLHWVSFGAVIVVAAWILMSLGFGFYLTSVASYGSIFGSLATVFVVLEFLYLSALVFVTGLQLDALAHDQVRA